MVQEISYIQDYDLENGIKVTKSLICLKPVTMLYPLKSDEYQYICSRNISILAVKSTFVDWVLTLKMEGGGGGGGGGSLSPKHNQLFRLS